MAERVAYPESCRTVLATHLEELPPAIPMSPSVVRKLPNSCPTVAPGAELWPKSDQHWPPWPMLAQIGQCLAQLDQHWPMRVKLISSDLGPDRPTFEHSRTIRPTYPDFGPHRPHFGPHRPMLADLDHILAQFRQLLFPRAAFRQLSATFRQVLDNCESLRDRQRQLFGRCREQRFGHLRG